MSEREVVVLSGVRTAIADFSPGHFRFQGCVQLHLPVDHQLRRLLPGNLHGLPHFLDQCVARAAPG